MTDQAAKYTAKKRAAAARSARQAAAGQEIGPLPPIGRPDLRRAATHSLRAFCETYFPESFSLAWSPDHLRVIDRLETVVCQGGLFALAMPRGSGKSTLVRTAALWAVLCGLRRYVVLIGPTAGKAEGELAKIQAACETATDLQRDWPEVLYPVARLGRITQRQKGQTYLGQHTRMTWLAKKIIFPTIPGSAASGAILTAAGLQGGDIRGQSHYLPTGEIARPDLTLIDDPQTTESAYSRSQSERREALIAGDVLGMAGPKRKIAALMPCTVICPGDLADRMLDRTKHPDWQGEKTKMIYSFPLNENLWAEYATIRAEGLRAGAGTAAATAFYRAHRADMDAGAHVAWPDRYNEDEISGLQRAMNWRLTDEAAFFAEGQNEPQAAGDLADDLPKPDAIARRTNGHARGLSPAGVERLTMFIDVQQHLLWYAVTGWSKDFTGSIVDYGSYPDQGRTYYTLKDAKKTLGRAAPGAGMEGAIYTGLQALTADKLGRDWERDDGAKLRVERCLIDANWGGSTETVYRFCRESPHAALILPSHGKFVGAGSKPMSEYERRPGERAGLNWRVLHTGQRKIRHAIYDTNYWKSFIAGRLTTSQGDRGALTLYGDAKSPRDLHRMLADHLCAEYRVRTTGRGRTVDEWKWRADRPDNHLLDCVVGCAVAASIQGVELGIGAGPTPTAPRRRQRQRSTALKC